jgi:hypothetical protein
MNDAWMATILSQPWHAYTKCAKPPVPLQSGDGASSQGGSVAESAVIPRVESGSEASEFMLPACSSRSGEKIGQSLCSGTVRNTRAILVNLTHMPAGALPARCCTGDIHPEIASQPAKAVCKPLIHRGFYRELQDKKRGAAGPPACDPAAGAPTLQSAPPLIPGETQ